MIEYLEHIDQQLFIFLNGIHSPFFDTIMWFISGKFSWIPLYAVLLFFMLKKEGKFKWYALLAIVVLITLSDQISNHFFKEVFLRYRPSHNFDLQDNVHLVNNYRGGKYGFVSSHAANSFALATFLAFIFKNKYVFIGLLFWSVVVSYSRVYLGVHYPADVVCGGLIGSVVALFVYFVYQKVKKSLAKPEI